VTDPSDARKHPRYAAACSVDVLAHSGMQRCETEDLSAGGCRVVTVFPLSRGDVRVRLRSPRIPFEVSGAATVVWASREPPYRAGIRFTPALIPEAARFLHALLGPVRLVNG
jgi:hypothetical protein